MKPIPVRQITTCETANTNTGRFSIRDIQQILNGRDLTHNLHRHDFFFILAISKGTGIHEIDFFPYAVKDNTIFVLRPGQVHRLELKANCEGYLMEFDLPFYQQKNTGVDQAWKNAISRNHCEVKADRFTKFHSILTGVFKEFTAKQENFLEAIKAYLDLFFIEYLREKRDPKRSTKSENIYVQERFDELLRLLEDNIAHKKNVSQYADLLNLSAYRLNSITRSSVGKTVSDLINEQIILEAKRYLLTTSNQIKDVADHLGYDDVSYFIRFFKKHTLHGNPTRRPFA